MSWLPRLPPNFEAALRDVGAVGPEFRVEAAASLANPPPGREAEARAGLRTLLDDRWAPVRQAAVAALGHVGVEADLERLRRAVDDPHAGVREAAVEALVRLGREEVGEDLVAYLDHRCAAVRFQAVRGLASFERPEAIARIASLLDDPDEHVRAEVAAALGESGDASHAEALVRRLSDASEEVRTAAALALASLGDRRAIAPLRRELDRGTRRIDAALALGSLRADEAKEDLALLAGRFFAPAFERAAAAQALVTLGDRRGVAALARILRSPFGAAKEAALECAGELGIVELLPELSRLVDRPGSVDPERLAETLLRLEDRSPEARALRRRLHARS